MGETSARAASESGPSHQAPSNPSGTAPPVDSTNYVPRPYDGDIALFAAKDNVLPESMPKDLGWGALSMRALERYEIPGDHLAIMSRPNVEFLAEQLRKRLTVGSRMASRSTGGG